MVTLFACYTLQRTSSEHGQNIRLLNRMFTRRIKRELSALGHGCALNGITGPYLARVWVESNDDVSNAVRVEAHRIVREAAARVRVKLRLS